MDIKKFALSYYNNATKNIHIKKVMKNTEAQKPHTHNYFQIYYVIKGHVTHHVGNNSSSLYRGDMTIVPPNVKHNIEPIDSDTIFYSFSFMLDLFELENKRDKIALNFLEQLNSTEENSIHTKLSFTSSEILYLESVMDKIYNEFTNRTIGSEEIIHSNAVIILTMFARVYFQTIPEAIPSAVNNLNEYILYCIQYIDSNFTEQLSLSKMARRSAMSVGNFCNAFISITGHSFKKYLNLKRIEYAVSLIKKNYPLTTIYSLVGYNDYSTFNRNFKKIMGATPSIYNKNRKKN